MHTLKKRKWCDPVMTGGHLYIEVAALFLLLCLLKWLTNNCHPYLLIMSLKVTEGKPGGTCLSSAGFLMFYQHRTCNIRLFWGFILLFLLRICYPRQHHKMPNSGFYETASRRTVDSSPISQVNGSGVPTAGSAWCPDGHRIAWRKCFTHAAHHL